MKPNLYTAYGKTLTLREWLDEPECESTDNIESLRTRVKRMPIKQALAPEPRRGKRLTIDGETKTIIEWSENERCSVKLSTICARLNEGWTPEDAVFTPNKLITNEYIEAWGESKTFYQWTSDKRCNITTEELYRKRLASGMSSESALEAPYSRAESFHGWGQRKTLKEWSEDVRAAVDAKTIYDRVKVYGWSVEEAVTTPITEPITYEAFGEEKTMTEWFRDDRCIIDSFSTIRHRVENMGLSMEEAITKPRFKDMKHEAFGEIKTFREWLEDPRCLYGYDLVLSRINHGATMEEALSTPKIEDRKYEWFGEFKTLTEWADDERCQCEYIVLRDRLSSGWSFEDALLVPKKEAITYEAFGESKTIAQWLEDPRCVVNNRGTLGSRLKLPGFSVERALTEPITIHSSMGEREVAAALFGFGLDIVENDRTIISPKELDVYIPEKGIAIEFNGLYWHSEKYRDKHEHYDKWKLCKDKGVSLIQIWEDDWRDRRNVVESVLQIKLGIVEIASNISIDKNVSWVEASQFLDNHHILGQIKATRYYGLRDNNGILVGLACFTKSHGRWNLARFAASKVIPSGLEVILDSFRANNSGPIQTTVDLTISDGSTYLENGFTLKEIIDPSYYFVVEGSRVQKYMLKKKDFFTDTELYFEPGRSLSELAELNDIPKVYDAGKAVYILK